MIYNKKSKVIKLTKKKRLMKKKKNNKKSNKKNQVKQTINKKI